MTAHGTAAPAEPSPPGEGLTGRGLARRFGRRPVLAGLDLHIRPGEVVGLLGPNGAGKTTTFRLLAGLLRPHGGQVWLDGVDVTRWPLWRRARGGLGYLPQQASIFRRLSVRANVEVGLARRGLSRGARRAEADALLAQWGLAALADARGDRLSGGERRRVEIVRALAAQPRILLVDEPFAGLDPLAVGAVTAQLRALAGAGVGVLLTDHQVRQALEACDRVYILAGGASLFVGAPADAVRDAAVQTHYLGSAAGHREDERALEWKAPGHDGP